MIGLNEKEIEMLISERLKKSDMPMTEVIAIVVSENNKKIDIELDKRFNEMYQVFKLLKK